MPSNRPEAACERPGGHGAYPRTPEAAQGRTAGSLEASRTHEVNLWESVARLHDLLYTEPDNEKARNMTTTTLPITTEIVTVTPEMAQQMLERNHGNRNLSRPTIRFFADCISRDEWQLTHQGIAFDLDGNLLDGQHRLAAVIAAGRPVQVMVTRGLPRRTFTALDQGRRRQAGQILRVPQAHLVAGIARRSMMVESPGLERRAISNQMVVDYVSLFPEVLIAAQHASKLNVHRGLTGSLIGSVILQALASPFKDRVDEWVEELTEGVGLTSTSPSRHLINRFSRQTARQIGESLAYALMVKAWNAYALNQPMALLKASSSEQTPTVVGFQSRWRFAQ